MELSVFDLIAFSFMVASIVIVFLFHHIYHTSNEETTEVPKENSDNLIEEELNDSQSVFDLKRVLVFFTTVPNIYIHARKLYWVMFNSHAP